MGRSLVGTEATGISLGRCRFFIWSSMPRPDLQSIGSTGLTTFGGQVYEEFLRELQGDRWRRVLREMIDQDPVIGSILFAVEMLIRQVDWRIVSGADDSASQEAAEFISSALDDMEQTWPDLLSEILSFLPWGWSWLEVVYKYRNGESLDPSRKSKHTDGRLGWRSWGIRSQETLDRWQFADDGQVEAMVQIPPPSYQARTIPRAKSLHFKTTSRKGNPEGRSILRSSYRPYYFKKHVENIEGIGVERDLAGLPVAWVPAEILSPTRDSDQTAIYNAVKELVINIRRDEQEGIIFPLAYDDHGNKIYDLTLLTSGGRRQFDTGAIVMRYDQRIAMTVLADFILLGHEKVGSFALNSSKTELFSVAIGAWLAVVREEVQCRAIPELLRLNGMKPPAMPQLKHGDIESVDLKDLGEYISKLSGAGANLFPEDGTGDALKAHLLRQAKLPVMEATE
jgi:hypothetical protein